MTTRSYVRYVCPSCGHHTDVRLRNPTITCTHPKRLNSTPVLMVREEQMMLAEED